MAKPLAEQTAQALRQYIIDQSLESGDKLPTEPVLTQLMGVGRSSIREAVKILVSSNVLEVRQGAGIFVSANRGVPDDPLGFLFIRDKAQLTLDLMEMRLIIEPPITALAAQRATQAHIDQLSHLYDQLVDLIGRGADYMEVDVAFHRAIATASQNVVVPNLTPIIARGVDCAIVGTGQQLNQETLRSHREILDAIQAHDSIAAQAAMTRHLTHNQDFFQQQSAR